MNVLTERIDKYLSDVYWTDVNIQAALQPKQTIHPVSFEIYAAESTTRPLFREVCADLGGWEKRTPEEVVGRQFGPSWKTFWFRLRFPCLTRPDDRHDYYLQWDSNSEALLYLSDGFALQAFTGGTGADRRDKCCVTEHILHSTIKAENGDSETIFYVEMACNEMFGTGTGMMIAPNNPNRYFTLSKCEIVKVDKEAHGLFWDMKCAYHLIQELPDESSTSTKAISTLNEIINKININDDNSIDWARHKCLTDIFSFHESHCKLDSDVYAIGHCHIDTAWLWPYAETRRKIARSWSTQLHLMKQYPQFKWKFALSQSCQFEWLKMDYPELFERVKEKIVRKEFMPVGGTYVEFDANIPSSESMIRQFLYGSDFFLNELETRTETFWLPDTFGYSGQLPQLMKNFKMNYFLSQKLSWNLINKFQHNSFYWEGIDGSRVLAHFPPADNYNSGADAREILKSSTNNKSKLFTSKSILLFGHGDGGGGPAQSHLEQLQRFSAASSLPRINTECTPCEVFAKIKKDFENSDISPPVFIGELYLELHQGSLTSQAKIKWQNRRCEEILRSLEACLVTCFTLKHALLLSTNDSSQRESIETNIMKIKELGNQVKNMWKKVLLNQFHDVIPGTSIGMVYEDSNRQLGEVLSDAGRLIETLILQILVLLANYFGRSCGTLLYNPSNCTRDQIQQNFVIQNKPFGFILCPPENEGLKADSELSHQQIEHDKFVCYFRSGDDDITLTNTYLQAKFSLSGQLISLKDKLAPSRRELVNTSYGFSNDLYLYDDVPFYWDAWDIMDFYKMTGHSINTSGKCIVETFNIHEYFRTESSTLCIGNLLQHADNDIRREVWDYINEIHIEDNGICVQHYNGEELDYIQFIILRYNSPILEFKTIINWREKHKLLKVHFPLNIRSMEMTSEIQCGTISRPVHDNTPQDAAKYEVCGHRFSDISERGYGIALINDCKYGHSARGPMDLSLSLLRSPKKPDDNCDMGTHFFGYALMPHRTNSLKEVIRQATIFNERKTYTVGQSSNSKMIASSSKKLKPDDVKLLMAECDMDKTEAEKLLIKHGTLEKALLAIVNMDSSPLPHSKIAGQNCSTGVSQVFSLFEVVEDDSNSLIIDCIKFPESFDRMGEVILRLYESSGNSGRATIKLGLKEFNNISNENIQWQTPRIENVTLCDADEKLERVDIENEVYRNNETDRHNASKTSCTCDTCHVEIPSDSINTHFNHFFLSYSPYKIITLKLTLAFLTNRKRARELKV